MPIAKKDLKEYREERKRFEKETIGFLKNHPDSAYTAYEIYEEKGAEFPVLFKDLSDNQRLILLIEALNQIVSDTREKPFSGHMVVGTEFKGITYFIWV